MLSKILKNPSLAHASDLLEICSPLNLLGICYFSHVHINEKNQFAGMGLYPEFAKCYLEKKYYHFDIHMASFFTGTSEQYVIWDDIELTAETKALDQDFRDFGLGHTFTIMQKRGKNKDFYHFSTKLGDSSVNQRYLQNLGLLKQFINYFSDQVNQSKKLNKGYNLTFSLDNHNGGYFAKDIASTTDQDLFNIATTINRLYFEKDNYLTIREIECLHWFSLGKTIEEAAIIMQITPRTIKAHIKNIKMKFQCINQFQLGMLCERFSWIIPTLADS